MEFAVEKKRRQKTLYHKKEDMMNVTTAHFPHIVAAHLFALGLISIPLAGWAANECTMEFKAGSQTMTKSLSAGQTFTFSPAVSGVSWVRNTQMRPVDIRVTNLAPVGVNPKWVTLPTMHARDPLDWQLLRQRETL